MLIVAQSLSKPDAEMAGVLLGLEMLSNGSCQAWNPSGGHCGEPDDRMVSLIARHVPHGADQWCERCPAHVRFRRMYLAQASESGRQAVLAEARAELESARRRQKPPEDDGGDFEQWVLDDGAGWPAEAVAERFGVHPAFVRRIRQRDGREVELGRGPEAAADGQRTRGRARELRARGLTLRQIALALGVSKSTAGDWTTGAEAMKEGAA